MQARSLGQFEGELKRILLFNGDSYAVVNKQYNDLLEHSRKQCDQLITEPVRACIYETRDPCMF